VLEQLDRALGDPQRRDPDGRRDGTRLKPVELEHQPLHARVGLVLVAVAQQEGEPAVAGPRDEVLGTRGASQRPDKRPEQGIAGLVAALAVKIVQPVDLEHRQRAGKVVAFGADDLVTEPGAEGLDGERSRQRISAATQDLHLELGDALVSC